MKLAEYLTIADRHEVFAERLAEAATDDYRFHFSAKDNLCSTEFQARAGSKILDGYRPPFDATAVKKMRDEGGLLIGKTNMDEFGFGTFSVNSAYGVPKNPFDPERSCGGSSGGGSSLSPAGSRSFRGQYRRFHCLSGFLLRGGRLYSDLRPCFPLRSD